MDVPEIEVHIGFTDTFAEAVSARTTHVCVVCHEQHHECVMWQCPVCQDLYGPHGGWVCDLADESTPCENTEHAHWQPYRLTRVCVRHAEDCGEYEPDHADEDHDRWMEER